MNCLFRMILLNMFIMLLCLGCAKRDGTSLRQSSFVTVNNVRLHYLDWGNTGETLLFLSGLGETGYIFDDLAPHFTDNFRVLALTRRGHGQSEKPKDGYDIDTLVEDILQFINAMKINRVTLVGHSFAGDELTRFAILHPDRIRNLIYLDAGYDFYLLEDLFSKMPRATSPSQEDLSSFSAYRSWLKDKMFGFWSAAMDTNLQYMIDIAPDSTVKDATPEYVYGAILQGTKAWNRDFKKINCPVLSIYALQDSYLLNLLSNIEKEMHQDVERFFKDQYNPWQRESINRFKNEIKNCTIIELPNTHHHCFLHKQDEVVNEMKKFQKLN